MRTHYEVLGISQDASPVTIRQTYLRLLQIYHPDHNSDPAASRITAEIIEAYAVVGDLARRREYDATLLREVNSRRAGTTSSTRQEVELEAVVCTLCGAQNSTLRATQMLWVASAVLVTWRRTDGGIWCSKCRAKRACQWTTVAGICGWWGFPWGPIYTFQALFHNAWGGKQDPIHNANLLRIVGYQLYQRNQNIEAIAALDASLAKQEDKATRDFLDVVKKCSPPFVRRRQLWPELLAAVPSFAVVFLGIAIIAYFANQPSGYAASYRSPGAERRFTKPPDNSEARDQVNSLVGSLASAVEASATLKGSHIEGTTTINDYLLDRSKYKPEPFVEISERLRPFLRDRTADADGFASSAYFNASIMGFSVSILNGIDRGQDISEPLAGVLSLDSDQEVGPWLRASQYYPAFLSLSQELRNVQSSLPAGPSETSMGSELEVLSRSLKDEEAEISAARNRKDAESEHAYVSRYNQIVEEYNALLKKKNRLVRFHDNLDLAFNKCLDPAVLLTKFNKVDLTTETQPPEMKGDP